MVARRGGARRTDAFLAAGSSGCLAWADSSWDGIAAGEGKEWGRRQPPRQVLLHLRRRQGATPCGAARKAAPGTHKLQRHIVVGDDGVVQVAVPKLVGCVRIVQADAGLRAQRTVEEARGVGRQRTRDERRLAADSRPRHASFFFDPGWAASGKGRACVAMAARRYTYIIQVRYALPLFGQGRVRF